MFHSHSRPRRASAVVVASLAAIFATTSNGSGPAPATLVASEVAMNQGGRDIFDGAVSWINTSRPIRFSDLRGKIVLLDFWTYCCINCHHILPDLEYLEKKYANELVVIGVHSPKFTAEQSTELIRKKVAEYRIKHPIANDANQAIWNRLGINSWPTLVLISATGEMVGSVSGEGHRETLDQAIGELVAVHKAKNELNLTPMVFPAEVEKPHSEALLFPGKVIADTEGKRLFISDTGHNRIVVTDLEGKHIATIGGGETGLNDGSFDKATFNRPQGMCLFEGVLYVADTENHAVRAVDLESRQVSTIAGTGEQSYRRSGRGKAKSTGLNSPWDILPAPGTRTLLIAMAGPHQIWTLDLDQKDVGAWAGSGNENIVDGSLATAAFAQPSGLATDGTTLFVADSEVSGVRAVALRGEGPSQVKTVVGRGLFDFGDKDGKAGEVRLQHCLGLAYHDGKLYIADTYNNKIKVCDPAPRVVKALVGSREPGFADAPAQFSQPGGIAISGDTLYIADTNNHAIRAVDLESKATRTLKLEGVAPPSPRRPKFANAAVADLAKQEIAPGSQFQVKVTVPLPAGFKINPDGSMPILVETVGSDDWLDPSLARGGRIDPPGPIFTTAVPLARTAKPGDELKLKVSLSAFVCREGKEAICTVKNFSWNVPVKFVEGAKDTIIIDRPAN